MSSNTPNLQLYKVNPQTDGAMTFNIDTMLNENWDKIDQQLGGHLRELFKHVTVMTALPALPAGPANEERIIYNSTDKKVYLWNDAAYVDLTHQVTEDERAAWNAKETPTAAQTKADAARDEAISVAATDATKKADAAETAAIDWAKSFGLGSEAKTVSGQDLNTLVTTGFYKLDRNVANTLNAPPRLTGDHQWIYLIVIRHLDTHVMQLAYDFTGTYSWLRARATNWSSWSQQETTSGAQAKADAAEVNAKNASVPRTGNVDVTGYLGTTNLRIDGKNVLRMLSNNPAKGPFNPIAYALRIGKKLFLDEEFKNGLNETRVYNNSGGSAVTVTRIDMADAPNTTKKVLEIKNDGSAASSPGLGGFHQRITSSANKSFVQIFKAKIPVGYRLMLAENSQGTNATSYWLTNTEGTGKWEDYVRISHCGNAGTFSDGGHVYVTGSPAPTAEAPLIWHVASLTAFDLTDLSNEYSTLEESRLQADHAEASAINWAKSFGLGGGAKEFSNIDYNTLTTTGFYILYGPTAPNKPPKVANSHINDYFYLINFAYQSGSAWGGQIAVEFNTGTTFIRTRNASTWGAWMQMETDAGAQLKIDHASYKVAKSNKDAEGIFTTVEYRRKSDDTLAIRSVLSGGTSPQYTTRTVTFFAANGTSVSRTDTFALTYDADGDLISEV